MFEYFFREEEYHLGGKTAEREGSRGIKTGKWQDRQNKNLWAAEK